MMNAADFRKLHEMVAKLHLAHDYVETDGVRDPVDRAALATEMQSMFERVAAELAVLAGPGAREAFDDAYPTHESVVYPMIAAGRASLGASGLLPVMFPEVFPDVP